MTYQVPIKTSLVPQKILRKIRVLIVDDSKSVCQLLLTCLKSEPDIEVIGFAHDGETALNLAKQLEPDVAIIDIEMPGIDGIETIRRFTKFFPNIRTLVLTSQSRQQYIGPAFDAGATGYLEKNTKPTELGQAIRFAHHNYVPFGHGVFKQIEHHNPIQALDDLTAIQTSTTQLQDKAGLATTREVQPNDGSNLAIANQARDKPQGNEIVLSSTPGALALPEEALSVEEDWSVATKDLLDAMPRLWTRGLFYLLLVFTAIIIPWLGLAKVDETGTARGKLEPKAKTVKLDAPVAGTVEAIHIEEGERVKAQQVLMEIESDTIRSELQQLETKQAGQVERLTQLELMRNQLSLSLGTQEQQNQAQQLEKQSQVEQARQNFKGLNALYATQKEEKLAQIEQFEQAVNASQANVRLATVALEGAKDKAERYSKAFQQGIIPEDRYRDIQQQVSENTERLAQTNSELAQARSRLKEEKSNYNKLIKQIESEIGQAKLRLQEQERGSQGLVHSSKLAMFKTQEQLKNLETDILSLKSEIAQTKSQIASLKFQLKQRLVKAPANGTVFNLPITGAGAVVQPGQRIIDIAPENSALILKAQMPPTESGFLKVGMPVKVKFDAYPFQDYGVHSGKVSWISPDSKVTETAQGRQETYELKIELDKSYIEGRNKKIQLTPGQTATAEVVIRQRRPIDFIIDPFKKLQKGGVEL